MLQIKKDDDDIEETLKEGESTIMSWTRGWTDRGTPQVSFHEKVQARPIPASGRCRSCRGIGRKNIRGRWSSPRGSSENLEGRGLKVGGDTLNADEGILQGGEEESGNSVQIVRSAVIKALTKS